MEAASATPAWVLIAYLIAGICFILALRGLSSPVSSQRGNRFARILGVQQQAGVASAGMRKGGKKCPDALAAADHRRRLPRRR